MESKAIQKLKTLKRCLYLTESHDSAPVFISKLKDNDSTAPWDALTRHAAALVQTIPCFGRRGVYAYKPASNTIRTCKTIYWQQFVAIL